MVKQMAEKPLSGLLTDTRTLNFRTNLDNEDDLVIELVRQYLTATAHGNFSLLVRKTLADYLRRGEHFANALVWVQQKIDQHDVWERQKIRSRIGQFISSSELAIEDSEIGVQEENDFKLDGFVQPIPKSRNSSSKLIPHGRSETESSDEIYEDFDLLGIGGI